MPFDSEALFKSLDAAEIIRWVTELKHGKPAYVALVAALRGKDLNVRQNLNALHALFRIRLHGSSQEVLDIFVECSQASNLRIRSEAVQLTIALARFSGKVDKKPVNLSEQQVEMLKQAIALGVTKKVSKLAREYLKLDGPKE